MEVLVFLYKEALKESNESDNKTFISYGKTYPDEELIIKVCSAIKASAKNQNPVFGRTKHLKNEKDMIDCPARYIYRKIAVERMSTRYPVYYFPVNSMKLHRPMSLHLFEPRYRLLISEVMGDLYSQNVSINRTRSGSEWNSSPWCPQHCTPAPRFIFAHRKLASGSHAALVEVRLCRFYGDGRADVVLMPVQFVKIDDISIRPDSGGLYDARVVGIIK